MKNKFKKYMPKRLKLKLMYIYYSIADKFYKKTINIPTVYSTDDAINLIVNENKSLCRFGDGEFGIIQGEQIGFQKKNLLLAQRLEEILRDNRGKCLICIPDVFGSLDKYRYKTQEFWVIQLGKYRAIWNSLLDFNNVYYDAFISRPYIIYRDKTKAEDRFRKVKQIWNKKSVVMVEGEESRLGIGNDLFSNANEIKRIICPSKNAFEYYEEILDKVKQQKKDKLILIALGPTATVLAYDLSNIGYQALDIGHIDIEYEWFLRKSTDKVKILGKYINEVKEGNKVINIRDENYEKQIIERIRENNL